MNTTTITTSVAKSTTAKAIYAASTEAANIGDLLTMIENVAKEHARQADHENHVKFNELRMAMQAARALLANHAEGLDILSAKLGAGGVA